MAQKLEEKLTADNPGFVRRDLCDERSGNIEAAVLKIENAVTWLTRSVLGAVIVYAVFAVLKMKTGG